MINLKNLKRLDRDALLDLMGLESKTSTVGWIGGTLGVFGVGLLVGAGVALMLAPKSGRELRGDIRGRWNANAEAGGDSASGPTWCEPQGSGSPAHSTNT